MNEIFENGYLKSEFINPNYRGLVGWPCERDSKYSGNTILETVISISGSGVGSCSNLLDTNLGVWTDKIRFKQFTPKDIPVGELCWGKQVTSNKWIRFVVARITEGGCIWSENGHLYDRSIPCLIAETAEDAERLKDWWKL